MAAIDYGTGPNTASGDLIPSAVQKLAARLFAAGFDPTVGDAGNVAAQIRRIEMALDAAEEAYVPPLPGTPTPTPGPSPIAMSITSTHAERAIYGLTDLATLKAAGGAGATASVAVAGTYTGAPTVIQARTVDYASGAQVTPWTTIVASPSGGAFTGTLAMAEYEGWQKIEVRGDTTSIAASATTTRIGAGILIGPEGQSQARYLATNVDNSTGSSAYVADDLTSVYAQDGMFIATSGEDYTQYPDVAWHWIGETYTKNGKTFLAGGGAGAIEAGKALRAALKVPVGFVVNAVGGVGLDVLNAAPAQTTFAQRLTETGRPHYVVLFAQGGNDLGVSEATYTTRLNNWRAWHTANIAYTPRRKFMISPLARRQTGSNTDIVNIRRPQMAHIAANSADTIFAGWGYDVSLADDVHQNAAGNALHGRRLASAIINDILGTGAATGPTITNVARSGANVALTVAFTGGGNVLEANDTTSSAGTLTAAAFEVTRNSDSAVQTISSIAFSGSTVTLTLSADPGSAVSVRYGVSASPGGKALADNTRYAGLTRGAVIRPLLTALTESSSALSISGSPGNRSVGDSAAFSPTVSGGMAPYTVSLLSGTLPAGRTLSNNTITGTYTTAGTYNYTLRVTDSASPAATADLAVTQTIAAASTLKTAKVNIGGNQSTSDGFSQNNYTGNTTSGSLALKDVTGAATGWTLSTTTAFAASNATGGFQPATPNSGVVPDDVLVSYFTGTNVARLNIAGLNSAKTYKITLVPSRNSTASRNTRFSINGGQFEQTVDADRNATLAAVFDAVPPDASGNITIGVLLGTNNTTGHYTNALIIEEAA